MAGNGHDKFLLVGAYQVMLVVEQERIKAMRISEPMSVTPSDPRHPRRLEKKKNTRVPPY
jgi:hypothetical protein